MDGKRKLPVFDHVPDFIYESTPVPESLEQCNEYILALKAAITDIMLQLQQEPSAVSHIWNGRTQGYEEWRKRALNALRVKQSQIFLLKAWKKENQLKSPYPEQGRYSQEEKNILGQMKNIELARKASFTPKEFSRLRREVKFIRYAIGEICQSVTEALEVGITESSRTYLEGLSDRLLELDERANKIESRWKETA